MRSQPKRKRAFELVAAACLVFAALLGLKDAAQVAETRTKTVEEITGRVKKAEQAAGEAR